MTTARTLDLLARYESRNVTFIDPNGAWPIVWERAQGLHVWDAAGRKYLDLTAAFGVAAAGHANPRVVRAGQRQMGTMLHAMGDVHPHALKARLACELSALTFERWGCPSNRRAPAAGAPRGKTIFCNTGSEAVEAALKTARLATGRRGVIAFEGAYHGLGYGALNATHREHFRGAFRNQLGEFGQFVPFPVRTGPGRAGLADCLDEVRRWLGQKRFGAVLVEPMQGRGGIRIPPASFLPALRQLCDQAGALLILDEIFTGFGRTGAWFACEHRGVVPDVICLGKALAGGFPLSACVGRADLMDAAWPASTGEAIHTSTFLGHPVGCAMALAQIAEIRRRRLVGRSARAGAVLLRALHSRRIDVPWQIDIRGAGLMAGVELRHADGSPATAEALAVIQGMLHRGFILLPEGEHGDVISLVPPLTVTDAQLRTAVSALAREMESVATSHRPAPRPRRRPRA